MGIFKRKPSQVDRLLDLDTPTPGEQEQIEAHGQCSKITHKGEQCKLPAHANGRCLLSSHQPERDEDDREAA